MHGSRVGGLIPTPTPPGKFQFSKFTNYNNLPVIFICLISTMKCANQNTKINLKKKGNI